MEQVRIRKTDAACFQEVPRKCLKHGETIGRNAGDLTPGSSPFQLTPYQLAACQVKPPVKGIRITRSGTPALAWPVGPEGVMVQYRDQRNGGERTLHHAPVPQELWVLQRPTVPTLPLSTKHSGKPARPRVTSELCLPTQ